MVVLEKLLDEAKRQSIHVQEENMPGQLKGLYGDNVVWINKNIHTTTEKACILAEELGHYHTSAGDILDQTKVENRKQERRARGWAYEELIPLPSFISAYRTGIRNRYELAEFLGVTEEFLDSAIQYYKERHGLYVTVGDYIICFEPLGVIEMFNERS